MRAEIKSLSSFDIADLEVFAPENPAFFRVAIRLLAGPVGEEGEESFDFVVCSPAALAEELKQGGVLLVRHRLLMETFDFGSVRRFVERYVRGCEAPDWEGVALKLSRLGYWEFEDYCE